MLSITWLIFENIARRKRRHDAFCSKLRTAKEQKSEFVVHTGSFVGPRARAGSPDGANPPPPHFLLLTVWFGIFFTGVKCLQASGRDPVGEHLFQKSNSWKVEWLKPFSGFTLTISIKFDI